MPHVYTTYIPTAAFHTLTGLCLHDVGNRQRKNKIRKVLDIAGSSTLFFICHCGGLSSQLSLWTFKIFLVTFLRVYLCHHPSELLYSPLSIHFVDCFKQLCMINESRFSLEELDWHDYIRLHLLTLLFN